MCSALVWGSSVKHQPQKVGKDHILSDEDVIQIVKKYVHRALLNILGLNILYFSRIASWQKDQFRYSNNSSQFLGGLDYLVACLILFLQLFEKGTVG